MGESFWINKTAQFCEPNHRDANINIFNVNYGQKTTRQFAGRKILDMQKIFRQIQKNTYYRKNKKNTMLEALKPNPETEIKKEPERKKIYTRKHGTKPEERQKERNCG